VRQVVVEPLPALDTAGGGAGGRAADQLEGLAQAGLLLQAAAAARRLACPRIIWPHQVGPDPEAVGPAVERASLVSALAEVGGSQGTELVIDLPLVDLTEAQLADLAEDGGAPMHGFWPCAAGGDVPCGTCTGCRRWRQAFSEAGVAWPWVAVTAS
jgi:7-cyano-7-deazaguanine synthase in queuosine biosynthesis